MSCGASTSATILVPVGSPQSGQTVRASTSPLTATSQGASPAFSSICFTQGLQYAFIVPPQVCLFLSPPLRIYNFFYDRGLMDFQYRKSFPFLIPKTAEFIPDQIEAISLFPDFLISLPLYIENLVHSAQRTSPAWFCGPGLLLVSIRSAANPLAESSCLECQSISTTVAE